jgi:hypothetical protein
MKTRVTVSGVTTEILLPFEKQAYKQNIHDLFRTEYFKEMLRSRMKLYQSCKTKRGYLIEVRKLYKNETTESSAWKMVRKYEDDWLLRNPNGTSGSPSAKKSHHNEFIDQAKLRQQRQDYRRRKKYGR